MNFENAMPVNRTHSNLSGKIVSKICYLDYKEQPVDRVVMNIGNKKNFLNFRPAVKVCNQYRDHRIRKMNTKNDTYFKNITVENNLLNLPYPNGCEKQRILINRKIKNPMKKSCITFTKKNYCPGNVTNTRYPIADFQMNEIRDSVKCKNFLPIGPSRDEKLRCELDWDNVTSSKIIRRGHTLFPN